MSWYERDYYRQGGGGGGMGQPMAMNFALPSLTPVVKYFLIANVLIFILEALAGPDRIFSAFALYSVKDVGILQVWRFITYQFLHGGPWHLFANMIGLYFFGTKLEQAWGSRRFVKFYLACGVAGGLAFMLLGWAMNIEVPIVGASGAILGILGACALLFPNMMVIVLFFPMPIRVLAMLFGAYYVLNILWNGDLADACHLAGMLTGIGYVLAGPKLQQYSAERKRGRWQERIEQEQAEQEEVDRILEKVHRDGITSLSRREKSILRKATDRQRDRDRR